MAVGASHLWLPFTQMRDFARRPHTFVRGLGSSLWDGRGHRLFDAVSSIWTTIHGHSHPRIVDAISAQARELDHATLLGATNPVAERLAERLCTIAAMEYAFFGGDGASAIEAALKMALQYWQNAGEPQRTRFVRISGAYHGDTVGAMSLSDIALFRSRFANVTFETRGFESGAKVDDDVAAIIIEPVVQAAAGMRLVPPSTCDELQKTGALLICDEIASGFGRTGTMFAFEQTSLRPDIVCVGKGLSGGTLAISATLVRKKIYEAFLGDRAESVHFFHGHSFAGNPIACAASLASLDLFEEERTLARAASIAREAALRLDGLRSNPAVRDVRQAGTMVGIELSSDGWPVADALYDAGHFTRPIGPVVQFVPPLCATGDEVHAFFDALEHAICRTAVER